MHVAVGICRETQLNFSIGSVGLGPLNTYRMNAHTKYGKGCTDVLASLQNKATIEDAKMPMVHGDRNKVKLLGTPALGPRPDALCNLTIPNMRRGTSLTELDSLRLDGVGRRDQVDTVPVQSLGFKLVRSRGSWQLAEAKRQPRTVQMPHSRSARRATTP